MPNPAARPRPESWLRFQGLHRAKGWRKPFFFLEWIWEWVAHHLSNWAFLEVLEYVGKLSVLVAVIFYFSEWPDRVKQRHCQAWQVINTAQGKGGNGGRIEALEELNREKISLIGVDASGAFLQGVQLERASLMRANFSAADMRNCNLVEADLAYSNLKSTNFRHGDLSRVDLENANLQDADLTDTNLSGADCTGANLTGADLRNCDLGGLKWKTIAGIKGANLYHVKNAPAGFIDWAMKQGAEAVDESD
jgi:hypothetical protein